MKGLISVVSFLYMSAGLVIAFWYVLRSGKIIKGILIGWGLTIVGTFLASVVFPGIVGVYNKECSLCFPDAIGLPLTIVTGWLPASLVAVVAVLLRYLNKRFWPHSRQSGTIEENAEDDKAV